MPEPLWKLRKRKGLKVNQLAAKSGVPAISIREYESGRPIRSADLPKLAKALYVDGWDIEIQSDPIPRARRGRPPGTPPPDRSAPRPSKAPPPTQPARQSQIDHLMALATRHFDKNRDELEEEVGKPLQELSRREASNLLSRYQKMLAQLQVSPPPGRTRSKRKRAYLPEGVDQFELHYLTARQQDQALLHFTLFDRQEFRGHVVGFSPYSITIQEAETGDQVTLQKLAIAYYRMAPSEPAPGDEK